MSTTVCDEVLSATARLGELMDAVNSVGTNGSDSELIDQITILERIKSACAASQARLTHEFVLSQTADGAARKIRPDGLGAALPPRLVWPVVIPGFAVSNMSVWHTRWSPTCPRPCPRWAAAISPNTGHA